MANTPAGSRSRESDTGALRRRDSRFVGLLKGPGLLFAAIFAVVGAGQIAVAAFFLARGHPALIVPREQPSEEWSLVLEGWAPMGACGLIMVALAWVMLRLAGWRGGKTGIANTAVGPPQEE